MFELVNKVLAWHNSRDYSVMSWRESRDRGATAVEYALIIAAITAAIAIFVFTLGTKLQQVFQVGCAAVNKNASCP